LLRWSVPSKFSLLPIFDPLKIKLFNALNEVKAMTDASVIGVEMSSSFCKVLVKVKEEARAKMALSPAFVLERFKD
jgi:hypothetical protein